MAEKSSSKGKKGRGLTQEEAVAAFQQLRQEQRALAAKIDELEAEKREHGYVVLINAHPLLWFVCVCV